VALVDYELQMASDFEELLLDSYWTMHRRMRAVETQASSLDWSVAGKTHLRVRNFAVRETALVGWLTVEVADHNWHQMELVAFPHL